MEFSSLPGHNEEKHVVLQCPANNESSFFNYKGTFIIVLLAVLDANYLFGYAHVGMQGRMSYGGVFLYTSFYNALSNGLLNLTELSVLPGSEMSSPYVLVADDAFPLTSYLTKPYAGGFTSGRLQRV